MPSYIFYKIPYEGSLPKIKEIIKNREWNLEMKVPKEGILLLKVPIDIEDEISFCQKSTLDEDTNTKLGALEPIKESEFEDEIDTLSNDIINENDEKEKNSTQNKKNKNWQYKRQITEILMNEETLEKEIPKKNVFNLVRKISLPKINLNQFNKIIEHTYKDPYDYLLSQNYLVMCFIIAIICLVLFNF